MAFFDNEPIVSLIERPQSGLLATLDEACANVGNVTDAVWLEALDKVRLATRLLEMGRFQGVDKGRGLDMVTMISCTEA